MEGDQGVRLRTPPTRLRQLQTTRAALLSGLVCIMAVTPAACSSKRAATSLSRQTLRAGSLVTYKVGQVDSVGRMIPTPGAAAEVTVIYWDPTNATLELVPTALPWTLSFQARPGTLMQVSVQNDLSFPGSQRQADIRVGCELLVDGRIADQNSTPGTGPILCRDQL